jgi:hypothetical protein
VIPVREFDDIRLSLMFIELPKRMLEAIFGYNGKKGTGWRMQDSLACGFHEIVIHFWEETDRGTLYVRTMS